MPRCCRFGFARGDYRATPDDGLELIDCRITNAVRCVPPANRPFGERGQRLPAVPARRADDRAAPAVILPLGAIAHGSVLRALGLPGSPPSVRARRRLSPFRGGPTLAPSYHCSRYNLNTGRLTPAMFEQVFATVRAPGRRRRLPGDRHRLARCAASASGP